MPHASLPSNQRRRRFPERELLDRLRRYESLLRQNDIEFEPSQKDVPSIEKQHPNEDGRGDYVPPNDQQPEATAGPDRSSSPSTTGKSGAAYKAR